MSHRANHLVVFAKAPRMGRVKTRLARDVGTVRAWAFYRTALADLTRRLGDGGGRWRPWLAVAPDKAVLADRPWPPGWSRLSQGPGDLGQRIFQQPFSWKELGVDVRGRSNTLRVNYRTSHQIRTLVDGLLPPAQGAGATSSTR